MLALDYRVGTREQRRGYVEAERLGGREIDHQLVLGWRLHRQVGRLLALEDAVDVAGRAAVLVDEIRSVGRKPTGLDEVAERIDRRQPVAFCNRRDLAGFLAPSALAVTIRPPLPARPVLGADRFHQSGNAQNAHHPFLLRKRNSSVMESISKPAARSQRPDRWAG